MHLTQISDWDLEDRLALDRRPTVVTFFRTGDPGLEALREELQDLADVHPDARFYEVDLLENPSMEAKFSLRRTIDHAPHPVTLVFAGGLERVRHAGPLLVRAVERALGPREAPGEGPW